MAEFPKSELETIDLATQMVTGFTDHPTDFPSVTVATLETALAEYQTARTDQKTAASNAKIATEAKDAKLAALVTEMKVDLKRAESDTITTPAKLAEIGWGPKSEPQPMTPPNVPTVLHTTAQGAGTVSLAWTKPLNGSNNHAANYLVQRRDQPAGGGEFGDWSLVNTVYDTTAMLAAQPRGVQMEYRVIAANPAGESDNSNTVPVVL